MRPPLWVDSSAEKPDTIAQVEGDAIGWISAVASEVGERAAVVSRRAGELGQADDSRHELLIGVMNQSQITAWPSARSISNSWVPFSGVVMRGPPPGLSAQYTQSETKSPGTSSLMVNVSAGRF